MNSTKLWFSSNMGDRERFYNILRVTNGVSRSKLRQYGKVENYNYGASPHYYIDNMKELHGLMRSLERIEKPYKVKSLWLTPHSRKNEFNLFIEFDLIQKGKVIVLFWLGFLFGDESRRLKELEQRKKDHQAERDRETVGFMVKQLTPQLEFMKKSELDSLTFPILDLSKFDYSLLSQTLSKIGSKISYTRLEKENGTFTLTLYKNRPEVISRLHRAYIL